VGRRTVNKLPSLVACSRNRGKSAIMMAWNRRVVSTQCQALFMWMTSNQWLEVGLGLSRGWPRPGFHLFASSPVHCTRPLHTRKHRDVSAASALTTASCDSNSGPLGEQALQTLSRQREHCHRSPRSWEGQRTHCTLRTPVTQSMTGERAHDPHRGAGNIVTRHGTTRSGSCPTHSTTARLTVLTSKSPAGLWRRSRLCVSQSRGCTLALVTFTDGHR
jgi:hypothetical protein